MVTAKCCPASCRQGSGGWPFLSLSVVSPVLRFTLDWVVIVHCHVCWGMWPCHYSCSRFLTVETTQKAFFLLILFADSFIRVCIMYSHCSPHSPLSSPVHMCCLYLSVIFFPHACLFVLWLSDFSQGHLYDYSFALPTGAWWAHRLAHSWRQCLSLPQNPLVANSSAGRGGAHEPLPDPWLTEQEILK